VRYPALILKGYKRFALNQIQSFTIRPTEAIQLILGTNGSGKSSLLEELTPLPANAADYTKDGSKEIHVVDRGHHYVLKSDFSLRLPHSFYKDGGENLNPGGTATVQKELVRQAFGVTPETHEFARGAERFTSMGPTRRREWFTRLSDVNYDYAITVYNRLKDEWRNVSGALKLDRRQLVLEQAKIITQEEQAKLDAEVKGLHAELTGLIELRAPVERALDEIDAERCERERELHAMSRRLLAMRVHAPVDPPAEEGGPPKKLTFEKAEDVDRHIEAIRSRITGQEAVLTQCVREHEKLKETYGILRRRGTDDLNTLRARIGQFQKVRQRLLGERRLCIEGLDPASAMQSFQSIVETLTEKLVALPANEEGRFSATRLKDERERLQKLREATTRCNRSLEQLRAKKQHADQHRAHGSVTCPKCRHVFVQGVGEDTLRELEKEIAAGAEALGRLEKQVAKAEESVAAIQAYGDLYREIVQIMRMAGALDPFWDHLRESNALKVAPAKIAGTLALLGKDLELEVKAAAQDAGIAEMKKLIAQSERLGDATLGETSQKLRESERNIEVLTRALAGARSSLDEFVQYRRKLAEAIALAARIEFACSEFEKLTHEQVEMLWRASIHQCIRHVQSTLARKEEILANLNQQKAIVANLERTIAQRALEEEALAAAMRELSPTDGLIAEGLLGFIRTFIRQMNQFISRVWVYPLEVIACGTTTEKAEKGAGLDYRFPLRVGAEEDDPRDDVSDGSTGMLEIVDLAFRIVGLKYLHLDDGPLLLDEWSATFDAEHRSNAINAIKHIMETRPFSQLFLISHYAATYGAFSNVQTCVLDARNIVVPKVYNTHVTMT
jgi:ABC-type cobalamin/Fe3+-siderophores transport system ATPase subunit